MWFASGVNGIARTSIDGHVTLFPTPGINVVAVASSADGNIWFIDDTAMQLGV